MTNYQSRDLTHPKGGAFYVITLCTTDVSQLYAVMVVDQHIFYVSLYPVDIRSLYGIHRNPHSNELSKKNEA